MPLRRSDLGDALLSLGRTPPPGSRLSFLFAGLLNCLSPELTQSRQGVGNAPMIVRLGFSTLAGGQAPVPGHQSVLLPQFNQVSLGRFDLANTQRRPGSLDSGV
ncbi:hypothetical protein D9M70_624810 [compost metagenome]